MEDYLIQIVPGRPPEATDDGGLLFTTTEDALLNGQSVLGNDSDADSDPFRVFELNQTVQALVAGDPLIDVSLRGADVDLDSQFGGGTFEYDPTLAAELQALNQGDEITDTFTYGLIENSAHNFESQTPGTVSITVEGLNDIPTTGDVPISASEDGLAVSTSFAGDDDDAENDAGNLGYSIVTSSTVVQVGTTNTYNLFRL